MRRRSKGKLGVMDGRWNHVCLGGMGMISLHGREGSDCRIDV